MQLWRTRHGRQFRFAPAALALVSGLLVACSSQESPGLSNGRFADAPINLEIIHLGDARWEFDDQMQSRLVLPGMEEPDFAPAFSLELEDGELLGTFEIVSRQNDRVDSQFGPANVATIVARNAVGIDASFSFLVPDAHPETAIIEAEYSNGSDQDIGIKTWRSNAFSLRSTKDGFWGFLGSSHEDRRDWARPLEDGFSENNFMGMNASDYGGGTPVADIWSRAGGVAVGHLETEPRLVSLPVEVSGGTARVEIVQNAFAVLAPDESLNIPSTFVSAHTGDFFAPLNTYRLLMAAKGFGAAAVPETSYEAIWCAWGYERDFEIDDILKTLPKAKELGLEWAVLDDGWQTAEGDWYLSPEKFPNGDRDMRAFVNQIKAAGMKPKLWVAPLAVDPGTDLMHEKTDMLLLGEWGAPQLVTWWNSFYLCPAYEPTVENGKALVSKIIGDWGYQGLKLDGQHLNGVAPCYNPAHNHARPEESIEGLQEYWRALYETAIEIDPDAVIELCPCGTSYAFHNVPYFNQAVASDPSATWGASNQVRQKGKTLKALMGPHAPYAGDHIELSDGGNDFASTVGIGAVVSTKFTWPDDTGLDNDTALTPEREVEWRKWIDLYRSKMLPTGTYRGELYDLGFDFPETHAIEKAGQMHYSFYAEQFDGAVELRGLAPGQYRILDYVEGKDLGTIDASDPILTINFDHALLIEAQKIEG